VYTVQATVTQRSLRQLRRQSATICLIILLSCLYLFF